MALAVVAENAAAQTPANPGLGIQSGSATVFVANPDDGFFVESWSADCANSDSVGGNDDPNPKRCVLSAPVPGGVSVFFAPVVADCEKQNRIQINPSTCGKCNPGGFGPTCEPGRQLVLKATPNAGTLSAEWPGDSGRDGDYVPPQTAVTLVADPHLGYYVSEWVGDLCQSAPDGKDDAETGLAKKCAVPATGAISVSVAFVRQRDCLSENRRDGDSVSACGNCNRAGYFALSDEAACEQGRAIVLQSSGDGTLFAEWAGDDDLQSGDIVPTLTAVTLSAKPGGNDYVSEWAGDCASSPTGEDDRSGGMDKTCVVPAGTATLSVSVAFVPAVTAKECRDQNRVGIESVSQCGPCTGGHFAPSKDEACVRGHQVDFSAIQNGTLSASWNGMTLSDGDFVPFGSTITLSAEPASGYYVSAWTGCETTEDNTGSDTDGMVKECVSVPTDDFRPTWAVIFSQQGASDTQRITAADIVASCGGANLSGTFRDTASRSTAPAVSHANHGFEVCHFFNDSDKTCYSLYPDGGITSSHMLYYEYSGRDPIDRSWTCDSRHPECGTGMKQRIEGNPLSGCVAEE